MSERFEHKPEMFVGVNGGSLVYVGVASREDFDKINLPVHDSGENDNGHVLVKRVGDHGANEVTVIFQYWIKSRTLDSLIADRAAERDRIATGASS
jgi:hypothetical protein